MAATVRPSRSMVNSWLSRSPLISMPPAPWTSMVNRSPNGASRYRLILSGVRAVDGDLVGGAERGQLAVHLPHLAACRVAEDEPVMQAQHLAVHVQHRLPGPVGDIGVLTQPEQALADHIHLSSPPALTLSSLRGVGQPQLTWREPQAPLRTSDERIASTMTWAKLAGASNETACAVPSISRTLAIGIAWASERVMARM